MEDHTVWPVNPITTNTYSYISMSTDVRIDCVIFFAVLCIGLFKMFSRWILHIFTTQNETEICWELTWMMHEIKGEDLLANCM